MAFTPAPVQERRRCPRTTAPSGFGVHLLHHDRTTPADHVNLSEGGLCLRVRETLEVRALVQLQLRPAGDAPARRERPVQCTGRVAWVVQRLDLRDVPPFLFDVGIEFVDPPPLVRQFLARRGVAPLGRSAKPASGRGLEPAQIKGRAFVPRIERGAEESVPWHLIVLVEGVPCFSQHYPSERAARLGWQSFKRQQARGSG